MKRVGLAVFACAVGVWWGAASPAKASITSLTAGHPTATEGVNFSGTLATFTTDNPFDSFSQSIDWGDGAMDTGPATINGDNGTVSGSHTYNEDGTYAVQVRVTESGGSPSTQLITVIITVTDGDLVVVAQPPITVSEGTQFAGPVAQLVDSGSPDTASKFTATINWGDGTTTAGIVAGTSGNFTIGGSHTYTDEIANGLISVTVSEPDANSTVGPVQDHLNVAEADTLTAHPVAFAASDATPFSGTVATFSDASTASPASDFTATINWADGATTAGTVSRSGGTLTVSGNHTYESPPSNYPVIVSLADDSTGTATGSATSTATVSPGKPSAITGGANPVTINRATLTGTVNPNGGPTTYSFQFGQTTTYGSTTPAGNAGFGNSGLAVSAALSGLTPGRTYHYRIVASSSQGTTVGADQVFVTPRLVLSLKGRRDGSFLVVVNSPGPGMFDTTVLSGHSVVGHTRVKAKRAGLLRIVVHPSRRGQRLIKHQRHRITLSVTLKFSPANGAPTSLTFPGLHPPR